MPTTASIDVADATRALHADTTGHADALASSLVWYLAAPDDTRTAALRAILTAHDDMLMAELVRPTLAALIDALATIERIVGKASRDNPAASVAARDLANLDRQAGAISCALDELRNICEAAS